MPVGFPIRLAKLNSTQARFLFHGTKSPFLSWSDLATSSLLRNHHLGQKAYSFELARIVHWHGWSRCLALALSVVWPKNNPIWRHTRPPFEAIISGQATGSAALTRGEGRYTIIKGEQSGPPIWPLSRPPLTSTSLKKAKYKRRT